MQNVNTTFSWIQMGTILVKISVSRLFLINKTNRQMLSGGIPYGPTFRHYLSKLLYKLLCATFWITMAANEFQESSYAIEGRHSSNEKAQMSDTHSKRGGWITFSFITGLSLSHNFIAQKYVCMFVMKIAEKCILEQHLQKVRPFGNVVYIF